LLFVEAKTRCGDAPGAPVEAVMAKQRRTLIATAPTRLLEQGAENRPFRIDVIAAR
jgi:Holliday junction resolvase-like predicted endonuclease